MGKAALPDLVVADAAELRRWLRKHHASSPGVWLALTKKDGATTTLTWQQAVDEALCVGWIDGQAQKRDDFTYAIRYMPRGPRSQWSQRNVENFERLVAKRRVRPAGHEAAEAAKADGRWHNAYAPQSEAQLPEDLAEAIAADPAAQAMLDVLTRTNRFTMIARLASVKRPETRARWVREYVEMLARHESPAPQKARPGTQGEADAPADVLSPRGQ